MTTKFVIASVLLTLIIGTSCNKNDNEVPSSGMYLSVQHEQGQLDVRNNLAYSERPNILGKQYTSDKNKATEKERAILKLTLDLMIPPNATAGDRQPLIIMIHGGGFIAGSKEDVTPSAVSFARTGYVTANINYRLTEVNSNNPLEFVQSVIYATDDAMNAVRFLKSKADEFYIDTNRIAIVGYSAGGGIALVNAMAFDGLTGTFNDYPGVSSKVQAAISTGATLVQPGISSPQAFFSFDRNDSPVLLFHANPLDGVIGTTWNDHVLPTQKLINDSGNECVVVAQPDRSHTVDLSVGAGYWNQERDFLWKHLKLEAR
jgi:dienelactone hydrolase